MDMNKYTYYAHVDGAAVAMFAIFTPEIDPPPSPETVRAFRQQMMLWSQDPAMPRPAYYSVERLLEFDAGAISRPANVTPIATNGHDE